jgi:uncharacterized protein
MSDNGHVDDRPVPTADEIERRLRPILAGEARMRFAYLFGSVASGENRPDSDIDVAVMLEPRGTLLDDAALHDRLADATIGTEVDMLVLNDAPLWLRFRAVGGRVLFSRDERVRIADRERVEKEFLDFKPYHDEYLRATRDRARRGVLSG